MSVLVRTQIGRALPTWCWLWGRSGLRCVGGKWIERMPCTDGHCQTILWGMFHVQWLWYLEVRARMFACPFFFSSFTYNFYETQLVTFLRVYKKKVHFITLASRTRSSHFDDLFFFSHCVPNNFSRETFIIYLMLLCVMYKFIICPLVNIYLQYVLLMCAKFMCNILNEKIIII